MNKHFTAYKTIGQVAEILSSNSKNGKLIETHTIRFWEKKFKQVKPHIFSGKRRYYDKKSVIILKKIQYLLKFKGMTINGVKKQLEIKDSDIDVADNKTINTEIIKTKINKISDLIKKIKNHG